MEARRPEDLHVLFVNAFNAGDLDALCSLYEEDAALVPRPGEEPLTGSRAIREVLQRFLAGKGTMELATALVVRAGNVALLRSNWRLSGVGSDGELRERADVGTEVVRCRDDGTWRYVIDLPFRTG